MAHSPAAGRDDVASAVRRRPVALGIGNVVAANAASQVAHAGALDSSGVVSDSPIGGNSHTSSAFPPSTAPVAQSLPLLPCLQLIPAILFVAKKSKVPILTVPIFRNDLPLGAAAVLIRRDAPRTGDLPRLEVLIGQPRIRD
jgi:hypothetical protein